MYTITLCRRGKYYTANKKGCFKKEFKTLDEIVKFYIKTNRKIYAPELFNELSRKELYILGKKIDSQLMISRN